ncbi:DNA polymerase [Escherichia coli]|nr:DNA polymerase [Escherichia coli]
MQTSSDCQLPLFLLTRPSGTPYTTISKNHAMIVIEDLKVTCQSQQRVRSASRGAMSGQNQVETVRYWIRAGMKYAVSLSTNSSGVAVRCLLFRHVHKPALRVLWSYSERKPPRHRLRAIQLKHWRTGTTVYNRLRSLGATHEQAALMAGGAGHWWRHSEAGLNRILTVDYFDALGLPRLA